MRQALVLLGCALLALPAAANDPPRVRAIEFLGNEVTRPEVMLREMVLKIGDPADPAAIERSRQGIQDLGLFKSVSVTPVPVDDGVVLRFTVVERWYVLPIPRFDANSEGESAYGLSLRWFNVDGRNHTFRGNWTNRDEGQANKERSTSYGIGYSMPFVLDSPYGISFGIGHNTTPITDFGGYDETVDSGSVGLTRTFARGPASQGWSAGLGLGWSNQRTAGENAPAPYGEATTLSGSAHFRDVRDRIYSDDGVAYGFTVAGATEGLGSDYSYSVVTARYARYLPVGETPHQTVHFQSALGSYHGGPTEHTTSVGAFGIGGTSVLRAYPGDFVVGDFYYHLAGEYLRPLYFDWLRLVVVAEAGNAFADASAAHLHRVPASIGVGLRIRLTFLVNVEVEAGIAWRLEDGGRRFFASRV